MLHFISQDDHKAFRRQLEDKRPIVESNLLSGKQYVASEPPVSDASDTEGKCAWLLSVRRACYEWVSIGIECMTIKTKYYLVLDSDSRYLSAEEQNRELTRSISREVAKLSEQWNQLIDHSDNWKHSLDEFMTVSHFSFFF